MARACPLRSIGNFKAFISSVHLVALLRFPLANGFGTFTCSATMLSPLTIHNQSLLPMKHKTKTTSKMNFPNMWGNIIDNIEWTKPILFMYRLQWWSVLWVSSGTDVTFIAYLWHYTKVVRYPALFLRPLPPHLCPAVGRMRQNSLYVVQVNLCAYRTKKTMNEHHQQQETCTDHTNLHLHLHITCIHLDFGVRRPEQPLDQTKPSAAAHQISQS